MCDDMAQKIRELRLSQNMTLEEVAKKVGVGKSTVRKWETGMIANMRRDKILLVANALKTTPEYLMGWEDKKKPAEGDPLLAELTEMLTRLDENDLRHVLALVQSLAHDQ